MLVDVGGEGEGEGWMGGWMGLYHHFDMETVASGDVESGFGGTDARPCGWVVCLSHGIGVAVDANHGLVKYLKHADISVVVIRVRDICHPLEEFICALVLVINVETWRGSVLATR